MNLVEMQNALKSTNFDIENIFKENQNIKEKNE
jgi:hypothetical protein